MAKKNFSKFLALATISGAIAAGISYFLKYRSFHAELDEDFHDFEGDDSFDGTLPHEGESVPRNYVSLGEKKEEAAGEAMDTAAQKAQDMAEEAKETVSQAAEEAKETVSEAKENLAETIKDATTIVEDTEA